MVVLVFRKQLVKKSFVVDLLIVLQNNIQNTRHFILWLSAYNIWSSLSRITIIWTSDPYSLIPALLNGQIYVYERDPTSAFLATLDFEALFTHQQVDLIIFRQPVNFPGMMLLILPYTLWTIRTYLSYFIQLQLSLVVFVKLL